MQTPTPADLFGLSNTVVIAYLASAQASIDGWNAARMLAATESSADARAFTTEADAEIARLTIRRDVYAAELRRRNR